MKLKCTFHNRRVMSVSNSRNFLHRTGDQSKCESNRAVLKDNTSHIERIFVVMAGKHEPDVFTMTEISCDKQQRPHTPRRKE